MRPLLIVYLILMCRVFSVFVPGVNPLHAGTPEDSARTGGASAWPKLRPPALGREAGDARTRNRRAGWTAAPDRPRTRLDRSAPHPSDHTARLVRDKRHSSTSHGRQIEPTKLGRCS
jgi:hypothetical protein